MSSFLRHRQRVLTALSPHPGNSQYIIPKRGAGEGPGPAPEGNRLVFAADTRITCPNVTIPQRHALVCSVKPAVGSPTQQKIMGVGFISAGTARQGLGWNGSTAVFGTGAGAQYSVTGLSELPDDQQNDLDARIGLSNTTIEVTMTNPPDSGSVSVGFILSEDTVEEWDIGDWRRATLLDSPFVGEIWNVAILDTLAGNAIVHSWKINQAVADGGVIPDDVGGADGILTLGGGEWITV